jgi:hypothetical protein
LKYRYHYDVKARCRNSRKAYLEQIEQDGLIDALYAITLDFVKPPIQRGAFLGAKFCH